MTLLKTIKASDFQPDAAPRPLDEATLAAADAIVSGVREGGREALIEYAKSLTDMSMGNRCCSTARRLRRRRLV